MRVISRLRSSKLEVINKRWTKDRETGLYLLGHHSFSDWTWTVNPTSGYAANQFILSTVYYVSPPSSVRLWIRHATLAMVGIAVCNIAATTNLKEGRIVSQIYRPSVIDTIHSRIIMGAKGGASDAYQYINVTGIASNWVKIRGTWWNSYNLLNEAKLATRYDYWDGTKWVEGSISYQARITGDTNKCGIGAQANAGLSADDWWDDTEIWG